MTGIELQKLSKRYGDFEALSDITFSIGDGEFCVILGSSGSGKTTLLNLISGMDRPTGGDIFFGEKNVNNLDPKGRNIAMVFQDYALYPHMTVYQNMAFPLKVNRVPREKADRLVRETAGLLSIDLLLERKPRELSGGQAQRVALGRALVRNPSVFLMDEPLSNLDAKIRSQVRTELKLLHRKLGKTFIYVTHDQQEAMALADKIIIINRGKVEQIGTPQEIYASPGNIHVASFIGDPPMNFFQVEEDGLSFVSGAIKLESHPGDHTPVKIGIRPESISMTPISREHVKFEVEIFTYEMFGAYSVITAGMSSGTELKIRSTEREIESGKRQVYVAMEDIHVFDYETGLRRNEGTKVTV